LSLDILELSPDYILRSHPDGIRISWPGLWLRLSLECFTVIDYEGCFFCNND